VPKIVDHDERREEILRAAIQVISQVGLDRTTTRLIASQAKYSNGVLVHYFDDKDAILKATLVMTHRHSQSRRTNAIEGKPPLEKLEAFLFENLPLDEERRTETLLEMSFWTRAASNPDLLDFQRSEATRLLSELKHIVGQVRAEGSLSSALSDAEVAELLIGQIDGLSVHAMLFPERVGVHALCSLMRAQLHALGFDLDAS
jgi:AcrR family transcriptional regulator